MWPVGSCLQVFSGFHYSYVWVELCSTPPQPSAPNRQSYKPPQCRLSRQASFANFTVCMFYMPSHEMHSFNIHESRKLTRQSMTRDRTGEPRDRGKEEQTKDYSNICLIWGIRLFDSLEFGKFALALNRSFRALRLATCYHCKTSSLLEFAALVLHW